MAVWNGYQIGRFTLPTLLLVRSVLLRRGMRQGHYMFPCQLAKEKPLVLSGGWLRLPKNIPINEYASWPSTQRQWITFMPH